MTLIDQTTRSGRIEARDRGEELREMEDCGLCRRSPDKSCLRQGDWIFVSEPALQVQRAKVLRAQALLSETGEEPHIADFCYRVGGERVWVAPGIARAVDEDAYRELIDVMPDSATWGWQPMRRYREVFVRGRVLHRRFRPAVLRGWHRVVLASGVDQPSQRLAFLE